ncbi:MAG TPA: UDP-N-acetyl glucosamine 2-epimerase [bacterium]|nr:UDP-N-acetyl glucosamine 2-epimerase [bacterium]
MCNILGARPQFIKYFPLSRALDNYEGALQIEIIDHLIHTGQHYDYRMSETFFAELGIKHPDTHLEVGSSTQGEQTAKILQRTEKVLTDVKPQVVIVYGDTNSTLAGALAAAKLGIPLIHVEAGLRSYNKTMPEEVNRLITDHISTVLCCPSKKAVNNLRKEGFTNIYLAGELFDRSDFGLEDNGATADNPLTVNIGDVMFDALKHSLPLAEKKSNILNELQLTEHEYNILTIHRAENTRSPDELNALMEFIQEVTGERVTVFPAHPRTKKVLNSGNIHLPSNILLTEPLGYFDMMKALQHSSLILTDSGGLQKEAYWLRVPCITLRRETEWTETVEAGWNILYQDYTTELPRSATHPDIYGDGHTAEKILTIIAHLFMSN